MLDQSSAELNVVRLVCGVLVVSGIALSVGCGSDGQKRGRSPASGRQAKLAASGVYEGPGALPGTHGVVVLPRGTLATPAARSANILVLSVLPSWATARDREGFATESKSEDTLNLISAVGLTIEYTPSAASVPGEGCQDVTASRPENRGVSAIYFCPGVSSAGKAFFVLRVDTTLGFSVLSRADRYIGGLQSQAMLCDASSFVREIARQVCPDGGRAGAAPEGNAADTPDVPTTTSPDDSDASLEEIAHANLQNAEATSRGTVTHSERDPSWAVVRGKNQDGSRWVAWLRKDSGGWKFVAGGDDTAPAPEHAPCDVIAARSGAC